MTIFEAISIEQDFNVHLQIANTCGKEPAEALAEVAEKYTPEQMAEAYTIIKRQRKDELKILEAMFILAIKSKNLTGKGASKKKEE